MTDVSAILASIKALMCEGTNKQREGGQAEEASVPVVSTSTTLHLHTLRSVLAPCSHGLPVRSLSYAHCHIPAGLKRWCSP